jgi:hypothetical protein
MNIKKIVCIVLAFVLFAGVFIEPAQTVFAAEVSRNSKVNTVSSISQNKLDALIRFFKPISIDKAGNELFNSEDYSQGFYYSSLDEYYVVEAAIAAHMEYPELVKSDRALIAITEDMCKMMIDQYAMRTIKIDFDKLPTYNSRKTPESYQPNGVENGIYYFDGDDINTPLEYAYKISEFYNFGNGTYDVVAHINVQDLTGGDYGGDYEHDISFSCADYTAYNGKQTYKLIARPYNENTGDSTQESVDTPSDWASDSINNAKTNAILPDSLNSKYQTNITRQEFCGLAAPLYEKLTGKPLPNGDSSMFTDVNSSSTYSADVLKMTALGVVSGVGDKKFNPDGEITRQEAAVILAKLLEELGVNASPSAAAFSDMDKAGDWAKAAIGVVQSAGIMSGVGENKFDPLGKYTREQSIATLMRVWDYYRLRLSQ